MAPKMHPTFVPSSLLLGVIAYSETVVVLCVGLWMYFFAAESVASTLLPGVVLALQPESVDMANASDSLLNLASAVAYQIRVEGVMHIVFSLVVNRALASRELSENTVRQIVAALGVGDAFHFWCTWNALPGAVGSRAVILMVDATLFTLRLYLLFKDGALGSSSALATAAGASGAGKEHKDE